MAYLTETCAACGKGIEFNDFDTPAAYDRAVAPDGRRLFLCPSCQTTHRKGYLDLTAILADAQPTQKIPTSAIILQYTCAECGSKAQQCLTEICQDGTAVCPNCACDMGLAEFVESREPSPAEGFDAGFEAEATSAHPAPPEPPSAPIIIEVRGGGVQDVRDIPKGVVVEVQDYDVLGEDYDALETNEDGDFYAKSIW